MAKIFKWTLECVAKLKIFFLGVSERERVRSERMIEREGAKKVRYSVNDRDRKRERKKEIERKRERKKRERNIE